MLMIEGILNIVTDSTIDYRINPRVIDIHRWYIIRGMSYDRKDTHD